MGAFFVRRLVGGVATWFVATFVFYSLVVSVGIQMQLQPRICDCSREARVKFDQRPIVTYALDKPWPTNYLIWLLNPNGTTVQEFTFLSGISKGHLSYGTVTFVRSSLLAGDFGNSWHVMPDIPVLALYGLDLRLFPLALAILLGLMLIALLQRRHRPHPYRSSRIPANARWRPAELWTTG